jgi:hypothetical protein
MHLVFLLALVLATSLLVGVWLLERRATRDTVDSFERLFPGECLICSYHRYGYQNGHELSPHPPQHDCAKPSGGAR